MSPYREPKPVKPIDIPAPTRHVPIGAAIPITIVIAVLTFLIGTAVGPHRAGPPPPPPPPELCRDAVIYINSDPECPFEGQRIEPFDPAITTGHAMCRCPRAAADAGAP